MSNTLGLADRSKPRRRRVALAPSTSSAEGDGAALVEAVRAGVPRAGGRIWDRYSTLARRILTRALGPSTDVEVARSRLRVVPGFASALVVAALLSGCGSDGTGAGTDARAGGSPAAGGAPASDAGGSGAQAGQGGTTSGVGGTSSSRGGTGQGGASGGLGSGGTTSGQGGGSGGLIGSGGMTPSTGGRSLGSGGVAGAGGTGGASSGDAGGSAANPLDRGLLGIYCGNTPSDVTQFEGWLGRPVDGILGYTGNADWSDYDGSVGWAVGNWGVLDRRVLWSVPLIPSGASLSEAAAGTYDDHYRKAAQTLSGYRPQEPVLYIRTGWEFNGSWFPWTAQGKAADFVGAFQHFVTTFRSVSNRFRFEWNVNVGDVGMNPEDAYPGDSYVDIVGMDFYWNTQWDPTDPAQAWNSMLTRNWGLNWHQDFANAHGKPTAYSEWGMMSDDGAAYIQLAKAWFDSHDVVYQTYWNADNDFQGKLSSGQYPNAGAAYRQAFGP